VVEEAYLCAFADLSRYEPTGKFGAWLSRLTYQQARLVGPAPRGRGPAPAATPTLADLHEPAELERAIDALPEVFRTVFVLRVVEGISGIETAASLGVHETTVRTRLYRALRRLDAEVARRARMHEKVMELPGAAADRLAQAVLARLPRRTMLSPPAT
jgi:RNA polymerase sigma-70 factor (ECF subfamily)